MRAYSFCVARFAPKSIECDTYFFIERAGHLLVATEDGFDNQVVDPRLDLAWIVALIVVVVV